MNAPEIKGESKMPLKNVRLNKSQPRIRGKDFDCSMNTDESRIRKSVSLMKFRSLSPNMFPKP